MSEAVHKGIGAILRSAREKRSLGFEEITSELKILPGYLKAMEEERFSDLPGDAYVEPFLKTYSNFLGVQIGGSAAMVPEGVRSQVETNSDKTSIPKADNAKRWLKVSVFFMIALAVIVGLGSRSDLIDIYGFSPRTSISSDEAYSGAIDRNLLLELMAFDSLVVKVSLGDKVLFAEQLHRGNVLRFANHTSYDLTLSPLVNGRVFADGRPLYFPDCGGGLLEVTLSTENFQSYVDTGFLGEVVP